MEKTKQSPQQQFTRGTGAKTITTSASYKNRVLKEKYEISWAKALDLGLRVIYHRINPEKHELPEEIVEMIEVDK